MRTSAFRLASGALLLAGGSVLVLLALQRGTPGSFMPHGYCFTWNAPLLWTHVISDSLIALAYVSIPLTLLYLVRKRADLPFNWIVLLFAIFILSCGSTHIIEVWTVWNPDYWLSGSVKVVTATASLLTAAALIYLVPGILAIPTTAALTSAKEELEREVAQRRAAEEELRRERAGLERRVAARTLELAKATAAAEAARADAEEANRQKDRFLAKVSHELRTPLQSTLSWTQLLKRTAHDPAKAAQAAERIVHNVGIQARLIDDLLDVSRILSGKMTLTLRDVRPDQVIERAVEAVRASAKDRNVELRLRGEVAGLHMHTDPARLEQVVWNLASNAVHASMDGGAVEVRLTRVGAALCIEVQDWGAGIAAEDLASIFEPFRQAGGGGNAHRGLGLGLAITRNIVELLGGEVKAHSEGLGRGASFVVRLPLPLSDGQEEGGADIPPAEGLTPLQMERLGKLRIAYVEDDLDIGRGCSLLLTGLGVDVQYSSTYATAVAVLGAQRFDVFLTDMNLDNGHTGIELLQSLRALPHGARTPAVALSAYGTAADLERSRAAGFARHLVKPVDATQIALALLEAG